MSATAFETKLAKEYSCALPRRFDELGGRLFLVDYDKSCAAHALISLIEHKKYHSCLLIVENDEIATAYNRVLSPKLGKFTVISTGQALQQALAELNTAPHALSTSGSRLRETNKNLIIVREEEGNPLLHRKIGDGVTLANLLAEASYEFVAVDGAHAHFSFEDDPDNRKSFPTETFERLTFLGKGYYIPRTKSYKALRAITTHAKGCVVLSDLVANKDAIELYAALDLLLCKFSPLDMRQKMRPTADNFSMDGAYGYEGACNMIYDAISYARCEDAIISICLQRTKGTAQRAPIDMEAMRDFLMSETDYMSTEEIFLRVMHAHMMCKTGGNAPNITAVIEGMLNNPEEAALPFLHTFFKDGVKEALEPTLTTTSLHEMSAEEESALLAVFGKYGAYHYIQSVPERTRLLRLKRDDSGFEYFTRRFYKNDIDDAHCYSVLGKGNDLVNRMMALRHLEKEFAGKVDAQHPLALVVRTANSTLMQQVRQILSDYTLFKSIRAYLNEGTLQKAAVMLSWDSFRSTPYANGFGGVIFLDVCPDIVTHKLMLAKAQAMCSGNVYVVATYSTPDGILLDSWQEDIKQEDAMLPFGCTESEPKPGARFAYTDILHQYYDLYKVLVETVANGNVEKAKPLPGMIRDLMVRYGTEPTPPAELAELDTLYAARLGYAFNTVFRNTASIGQDGEVLLLNSEDYVPPVKKRRKKRIEEKKPIATETCVLFNACAKLLRHTCDLAVNTCADCPHYEPFRCNDFEALGNACKQFFETAAEYAKKHEALLYEMVNNDIIMQSRSADDEEEVDLGKAVENHKLKADFALARLASAQKAMPHLFHAEHKEALRLREAVYQTYRLILRKYYKSAMSVLSNATLSSKNELTVMRQAVAARGKV